MGLDRCDRQRKGHLTRYEFVLAVRLVALAQLGIQATLERLRAYKERFPPARFELPANVYSVDFDISDAEKVLTLSGLNPKRAPPRAGAPPPARLTAGAGALRRSGMTTTRRLACGARRSSTS